MQSQKSRKSRSSRSQQGEPAMKESTRNIFSHGGGGGGGGKTGVESAPVVHPGTSTGKGGDAVGEPTSTERPRVIENRAHVIEINGPLTEKVVKQLWERGGSDAYGIDAHSLKIQSIESLGRRQCCKVRELDVSFNELKSLACLDQVPALQVLKAHANRISDVEDYDIPKGSNLEVVYLSGNALPCIPSALGGLRKLRELRLDSNRINGTPSFDRLFACRRLTYLNLSRNRINSVKGLESIGTLETLILASNEIESLHSGIRRLDNLDEIDLSGNRLQSIAELRGLKKLSVLRAGGNRISSWKAVPAIATLTELHLNGNRLSSAPPEPLDYPSLDVLDIGNNRIDEFSRMTSMVDFKRLMSLRVEGNPACREDPAISRTLAREMPWLLDIDGVDSVVFGGGTETPDPEHIAAVTRAASSSRSPALASPPSSSPKSGRRSGGAGVSSKTAGAMAPSQPAVPSSFTLSIASVMAEGKPFGNPTSTNTSTKILRENEKEKDEKPQQVSKGAVPTMRLDLGALAAVPKNPTSSKSGVEFGLRRPLSARGKTPRSPRVSRSKLLSGRDGPGPNLIGGMAPSSYALPVVRAASLRTGRGTRLKRIEDIDQMAKMFRNTVEAERNYIIAAAESRSGGGGGRGGVIISQGGDLKADRGAGGSMEAAAKPKAPREVHEKRPQEACGATGFGPHKSDPGAAGVAVTKSKTSKSRKGKRNRSLKEALAFSRKDDEQEAADGGLPSLSPTASEDSRSTVTDTSPSPPLSGSHHASRSPSSLSHRHSVTKDLAPTPSGSSKEGSDAEASSIDEDASGSWSTKKSLPVSQTAQKKNTMTTSTRASAHQSASGRNRSGFGAFRVPRTAKRFVRTHLESEQKQRDNQTKPGAQRLSKK